MKTILDLINTEAGRYLLGIKDKYPVVKVSDNSFHQLIGYEDKKSAIRATFFKTPKVKQLFDTPITKMEIANREYRPIKDSYEAFLHFTGLEEKNYKYPQVYLTTTVFSTVGLSNSIHSGSSGTFSTVRAGNALAFVGTTFYQYFDGANYAMDRLFTTWDTSSITSGATLASGFMRIVGTGGTADGNTCTLHLVGHTSASNTSLATSDWGNIASTSFGSVTFASFATGGNNDITLNASGVTAISKTSYTKIGARGDRDLNNSAPTVDNHVTFNDGVGYLSVTYTLASGGFFSIL